MAGPLTELTVAAQLLGRALGRRLRGELEPPPDLDAFRRGFQQLLDRVPADTFAEVRWCSLAANAPPWVDSGLQLSPGEEASYFICGRTTVVGALDIWVDPRIQVWSKVGTARKGLARLAQAGDVDGRIAAEIERIDQGDTRPRGWH